MTLQTKIKIALYLLKIIKRVRAIRLRKNTKEVPGIASRIRVEDF